jgi:hypothetical protein
VPSAVLGTAAGYPAPPPLGQVVNPKPKWIDLTGATLAGVKKTTYPQAVAMDAEGMSYTVGYVDGNYPSASGTLVGKHDMFITKHNGTNGTKEWTVTAGHNDGSDTWRGTFGQDIDVDAASNVYVVARATGEPYGLSKFGTTSMLIAKYNKDGVKQWAHLLGVNGYEVNPRGVAVDSNQSIVTSGLPLPPSPPGLLATRPLPPQDTPTGRLGARMDKMGALRPGVGTIMWPNTTGMAPCCGSPSRESAGSPCITSTSRWILGMTPSTPWGSVIYMYTSFTRTTHSIY